MNVPHPIHSVVTEHAPRPSGDCLYVPWWAKGDFARRHNTQYTTEEGSTVQAGQVIKEGAGKRLGGEQLYQVRGGSENARKTPREGSERHRADTRSLDLAATLVKAHPTLDEKRSLARRHGIDPAVLDNAPNAGVASMRLVNALRKVLNANA